jgi:hypothetical protein
VYNVQCHGPARYEQCWTRYKQCYAGSGGSLLRISLRLAGGLARAMNDPPEGDVVFILQIGGWVIFSCILMSFVEHQVHRKLMHRKNFFSARTASFKRMFEAHALVHHQHYSKIFSDEPVPRGEDKEIRLTVRKAPIKALPIAALIALVSWEGAACFIAAMTFHHWAWNKIHLEMHKPEQRVFSTWPVYKFLARYHCLHHRYPNRNFNVVFPLADYVLGTRARANESDLKYMQQWGL